MYGWESGVMYLTWPGKSISETCKILSLRYENPQLIAHAKRNPQLFTHANTYHVVFSTLRRTCGSHLLHIDSYEALRRNSQCHKEDP